MAKKITTTGQATLAALGITGLITACGAGEGSTSLLEDLEYLPAYEDEDLMHMVNAVDYEAVAEISGTTKPEPGASEQEYEEWADIVTGRETAPDADAPVFVEAAPWVSSPLNQDYLDAYSQAPLGFTLLEVDRIVVAAGEYGVVEGEYDIDQVEAAFGEVNENGVWGPVEINNRVDEVVSEAYSLELDERLLYGRTPETLAGLEAGEEKALAEVEEAVVIAEAIDANDWYWAGIRRSLTDSEHSGDYDWRGHGIWQEDGTQIGHFYWHFPDADTAADYERTIQVQMGNFAGEWGIEELETETDGQLVIAEVHFTESPSVIMTAEGLRIAPFN
ncbi:hypothetical protein HGQ17_06790 [Nesterenkonia sp. MY13]|uniref:Uncharacterized protein n=1 Tax=Nesterenkonia sedimenti TaxID=1463632 RepID=A0A7X8YDU1_9MICC|nr:hypothetical protein [Nesterenkonia sedimenti]NLS09716.1 hypothetical protein [Nesterenkonia sedimenti]